MLEKPAGPSREIEESKAKSGIQLEGTKDPSNFRVDPRRALETQALVSIPSVRTRAYILQEMSRSGMFLAFRGHRSCSFELEQCGVECGTHAEIAFVASEGDETQRCNVSVRVVRITRKGIGVAFLTHNPPQLAKLREFFSFPDKDPNSRTVAENDQDPI